MKFNELEALKSKKINNKYGSPAYIDSYVHYEGTEQISIHIKTGYGASEKRINEVIYETDLDIFVSEFKGVAAKEVIKPEKEPIKLEVKKIINKTKKKKEKNLFDKKQVELNSIKSMMEKQTPEQPKETKTIIPEQPKQETIEPIKNEQMSTELPGVDESKNKDQEYTHESLRKTLFETMVGVKDGSVQVEKSKAISAVAQTIINSFKAENEANKKLK